MFYQTITKHSKLIKIMESKIKKLIEEYQKELDSVNFHIDITGSLREIRKLSTEREKLDKFIKDLKNLLNEPTKTA